MMNDTEFNFMNEGTQARYNSTFEQWPKYMKDMYWLIVDKFNKLNEV